MRIRIEGSDLPGRRGGMEARALRRNNVQVGAPTELLRAAHDGDGILVGRLGLTDGKGEPRAARVRPPEIVWNTP